MARPLPVHAWWCRCMYYTVVVVVVVVVVHRASLRPSPHTQCHARLHVHAAKLGGVARRHLGRVASAQLCTQGIGIMRTALATTATAAAAPRRQHSHHHHPDCHSPLARPRPSRPPPAATTRSRRGRWMLLAAIAAQRSSASGRKPRNRHRGNAAKGRDGKALGLHTHLLAAASWSRSLASSSRAAASAPEKSPMSHRRFHRYTTAASAPPPPPPPPPQPTAPDSRAQPNRRTHGRS